MTLWGRGQKLRKIFMSQCITNVVAWGGLGKNLLKMVTSFMDVPIYTIGDEDCSNEIAIHEIELYLHV